MTRIYERDTDALFARAFQTDTAFCDSFLFAIGRPHGARIAAVVTQTRHRGAGQRGTIDLEATLTDGTILLIENKIDAGYSVTRTGDAQPYRYRVSVESMRQRGRAALSILLAPEIYLAGTRHAAAFDHRVSYEALRSAFAGTDLALLDAATAQAATPYEPVPNASSGAFHADLRDFTARHFPELVIKKSPNGNGVRPSGSNTIYFDVPHTLKAWPHLPRPRMSLQCRDLAAPSASVKIMLGGLGSKSDTVAVPESLAGIRGYLRPAGRSLGIVIDTPHLDTQLPFDPQVAQVEEALEAARQLAAWWNRRAAALHI